MIISKIKFRAIKIRTVIMLEAHLATWMTLKKREWQILEMPQIRTTLSWNWSACLKKRWAILSISIPLVQLTRRSKSSQSPRMWDASPMLRTNFSTLCPIACRTTALSNSETESTR